MPDSLQVLTTDELLALKAPEWLVEDFVAEQGTTVVYGEPGLGKSYTILDMVLTATTGREWFGGRKILRPLKTIYIVAEGVGHWGNRVRAYELHKNGFDHDNVLWVPHPVALFSENGGSRMPDGIRDLKVAIEKHSPDILVIDTWIRCTGAFGMNENDAGNTATVIKQLDSIRDEFGVSPIIIHHGTKEGNSPRGSGNLTASVERVIKVAAPKDQKKSWVQLEDEKGNHITPFENFTLKFNTVGIGEEPDGRAITSAILLENEYNAEAEIADQSAGQILNWLRNHPGRWRAVDISTGTGVNDTTCRKALKKLEPLGVTQDSNKLWGIN